MQIYPSIRTEDHSDFKFRALSGGQSRARSWASFYLEKLPYVQTFLQRTGRRNTRASHHLLFCMPGDGLVLLCDLIRPVALN